MHKARCGLAVASCRVGPRPRCQIQRLLTTKRLQLSHPRPDKASKGRRSALGLMSPYGASGRPAHVAGGGSGAERALHNSALNMIAMWSVVSQQGQKAQADCMPRKAVPVPPGWVVTTMPGVSSRPSPKSNCRLSSYKFGSSPPLL